MTKILTEEVITDLEIRNAIRDWCLTNRSYPETMVLNPYLLGDVFEIYNISGIIEKPTVYGLSITFSLKESRLKIK